MDSCGRADRPGRRRKRVSRSQEKAWREERIRQYRSLFNRAWDLWTGETLHGKVREQHYLFKYNRRPPKAA